MEQMTPLVLSILIHYFASPGDHPKIDNEAHKKCAEYLVLEKLLVRSEEDDLAYQVNRPSADIYFLEIFSIPAPVERWTIPGIRIKKSQSA